MVIRDEAFAGQPISVPVIDAHSHMLGYYHNAWYQAFNTLDETIQLMDHLGIDCIVNAPHSLINGDTTLTNETVAAAAEAYPGRIYGYIFICPHQGMASARAAIARYATDPRFVGFKLLPGYHGPLACPEYDYALDFAAEAGCPVLVHVWAGDPTFADIERAAQRNPALKLIMAHQGGGSAPCTDAYAALMRRYPNLYLEICGMLYTIYGIEDLVNLAGEDRVIYGSDMINLDPRFDLGAVIFSTLDDAVKRKLLAGNYLRLLEGSQMGKITL